MTYILYQDYLKGNNVIANYSLFFPPREKTEIHKMSFDEIHEMFQSGDEDSLRDATLALDEIHMGGDARLALRRLNMRLGYLAAQRRKRNLDIYFTSQLKLMSDIRIRKLSDYYIEVYQVSADPLTIKFRGVHPEDYVSVTEWRYFTPSQYHLDMYDTDEIIAEAKT